MKLIENNNKKYEVGNFSEELNRRAENIKIPKKRNIEDKFSESNEVPELNLIEMEGIAVDLRTEMVYDVVSQFYEIMGWEDIHNENCFPTDLEYRSRTDKPCITIGKKYCVLSRQSLEENNYEIIRLMEFYKVQNISNEKVNEIMNWFNKNKPFRASKPFVKH